MLGSILGDIIGSTYEFHNAGIYDFDPLPAGSDFTDDTVLTIAVVDAILSNKPYGALIKEYAIKWPNRGYGLMFSNWYSSGNPLPYYSFGNGSAMRVSAIGWAFTTLEKTIEEAAKSAECTHNHPEGIKGAEATTAAMYLARTGHSKTEIKAFVQTRFHYNLERSLEEIKPDYYFNETCQETVPEAITCFLESENFEDAIRKAIWLGGDSDTLACITGGMAEAFYRKIPEDWERKVMRILPGEFKAILEKFKNDFMK
jgi:ADP-ribosylglycohydrolase